MTLTETALLPPIAARRSPDRPGRSHSAETVAHVRSLIVESHLTYREAALRSGVCVATVGAWARRFGWRRVGALPRHCERSEATQGPQPRAGGPWVASSAGPPRNDDSASFETSASRSPQDDAVGSVGADMSVRSAKRRPYRHPPEIVEAARVRIEGSREAMERIAFDLGIERPTLYTWKRRHGWQRPSGPERTGPCFYRSPRRVGRPYGADAVGTARDLLANSTLSARAIAARAGIGRATLYRWIEARPDWVRHPARDTRGPRRLFPPAVIEAAHLLYRTTELSPALIAARTGTTRDRIYHWAKTRGWTRPRDLPEHYGLVRRRGRWVRP